MPIRKIESIRKRDDRIVPYDEQKIAGAIARAARSAGQENGTIGRDLAGVVTTYLERYREHDVPTSDEIQQLVEKILFETGHGPIARSYIVHRERKGRADESAAPPAEDLFPSNLVLVDGATRAEVAPWGRERIISALVKEAGLEEPPAAEIAGAVEQKIFRLGQARISTTLIRELVNQELLARGYGSKLRRQIVVGLPKYDLGLLLDEEEARIDPDSMCRLIGQTTLKQYALQEIFARDVADAHVEGRLHIHGLEEPLKLHALQPSAESILRSGLRVRGSLSLSEPARDARTFTAQLARLVHDARVYVSGPVTLGEMSAAYDHLLSGADDAALTVEMEHLGLALGDASVRVRAGDRTALSIASIGNATVSVNIPVPELRGYCRTASERGLTFAFERNGPAGAPGWRTTAQTVTVNLPQAFYRSEAGTDFYSELEHAIELAVKAHLQKRQLLRKFVNRETGNFGAGAGWMERGAGALVFDEFAYGLGLAGLNEAVRLLCGQEILASDTAVRLALRIVSYVFFRVREESARHGIPIALEESAGGEAADRFARIDAQLYPRARGLLSECGSYRAGLHARGPTSFEKLAVEARFHTLVPSASALADRRSTPAGDLLDYLRRLQGETLATRVVVE